MAQLCITAQVLYNDTKCLDGVYNKDDPYAMVAINQYSEPHEKILWNPDASTLTLNLEEKLLCRQQC
jgi:hypothetical protein